MDRLGPPTGSPTWHCTSPHPSAHTPRGQAQAAKQSQSISSPRGCLPLPLCPPQLLTSHHTLVPPLPFSHRHQPHKPLPPSSPQTPPRADSQFSASLPGAGKPETAQVGMDVCSPPAPPALTVSKPRRTFPVPHCLPGLRQQTPSLGPRSGPATQGALAGVGMSLV